MELRSKKVSVRGKVKIFFSTDVWFMVFKRSVFKIQKQRTKNCKDQSYGSWAINQNVPKFAVRPKKYNCVFIVFTLLNNNQTFKSAITCWLEMLFVVLAFKQSHIYSYCHTQDPAKSCLSEYLYKGSLQKMKSVKVGGRGGTQRSWDNLIWFF